MELHLSCTDPSKWNVMGFIICDFDTIFRADSRFALSQWDMALICNDVSHWLGTSLESALILIQRRMYNTGFHGDIMPWARFLHYWPFVWESTGHHPWCLYDIVLLCPSFTKGVAKMFHHLGNYLKTSYFKVHYFSMYHEVGHCLKWPYSSNVCIFCSQPAEGAVILWTSCFRYLE